MKKSKRSPLNSHRKSSEKRSKARDEPVREASPVLEASDPGEGGDGAEEEPPSRKGKAKEHKEQLERLKDKDPEFYRFLREHDKELLEFDDEDIDDDVRSDLNDDKTINGDVGDDVDTVSDERGSKITEQSPQEPKKVITREMIDLWSNDIKEHKKIGAVKFVLRAFRSACHCGDDSGNGSDQDYRIASSGIFNKVMLFVLNEMDGILRELLKFRRSGGKKDDVTSLTATRAWKKYGNLMRLYLGSALHVLNQMTDEQMASFTLKRVKSSNVFLAAFPALLRKYIKVLLHFWGTGGGALQVVSFLFLRDLCVGLGYDCLDACLKGIYKAYVSCCKIKGKYASISKLQHLRFLGNCVTELYGVDLQATYQHAFICIRQLATILRNAISEKPKGKEEDGRRKREDKGKKKGVKEERTKTTREAYLKVYDWQFMNCLELWTTIICTYSSDVDFQHLAYPLAQIILGVAWLVPTTRYLPIRMQCARMLNRIGSCTGKFIPVSMLLLDVLELKDLTTAPSGGVGKAVDLFTRKLIGKPTLKTRSFQEACIHSVVEQLAEHLSQWSYSIAFFELSFIPLTRLRSFCKTTKIDKFRKEIKELIRQVEANCEYTNAKRMSAGFSPSDPSAMSFLKAEKESGSSPLSQFVATLRLRAQQRSDSMVKFSVVVGEKSSVFGKIPSQSDDESSDGDLDDGAAVFSSSWLPNAKSIVKSKLQKPQKRQESDREMRVAMDEDVVEDLVLSSDDDEPASSVTSSEDEKGEEQDEGTPNQASAEGKWGNRKRPPPALKRKWRSRGKKQETVKGAAESRVSR